MDLVSLLSHARQILRVCACTQETQRPGPLTGRICLILTLSAGLDMMKHAATLMAQKLDSVIGQILDEARGSAAAVGGKMNQAIADWNMVCEIAPASSLHQGIFRSYTDTKHAGSPHRKTTGPGAH